MPKRKRNYTDKNTRQHCRHFKKRKSNEVRYKECETISKSIKQSNHQLSNNYVKVLSLFQTHQITHDIIQILSEYLPEDDLYQLIQNNKYCYDIITKSEAIFKIILKRECNYYMPFCIIQRSLCEKDLICNINNPTLIYDRWRSIVRLPLNHLLITELRDKTFQQYILFKPIWQKIFSNTKTFNTLYRILSFKFWSGQYLLNLFHNSEQYQVKRSLNNIEVELFNPIKIIKVSNVFKIGLVNNESFMLKCAENYHQFEKNFQSLYHFDKWFDLINWNYFVISGSSVLASLINKNWTQDKKHDVDIYSHSINYITFKQHINKLHLTLRNLCFYEYKDHRHLVTFTLSIKNRKIILQFIHTCHTITLSTLNKIIENFDLDICQVLYNVNDKQILCTGAFIQSLQTEYIIPYYLISNVTNQNTHISRIKKYIRKGFNKLLLPKKMSIKQFEYLLNNVNCNVVSYCRNTIPCDYFEVQKQLLSFIHR